MNVREEQIEGTRVISLEFENLDASVAAQLRVTLLPTVEEQHRLLLQVARIQFIDSAGMSLLRRMRTIAGDDAFGIVHVTDRMMGCLQRFPYEAWPNVFESVEEAHACDFQRQQMVDPIQCVPDELDEELVREDGGDAPIEEEHADFETDETLNGALSTP